MAGAFIVVLLVASGEGGDATTRMAARTTHDALEGDPIIIVREAELDHLNDAEATKVGSALNANAVAVVTWRDPQHHDALVHVRSGGWGVPSPTERRPEWVDRTLTFTDGDPVAERGRTIGFAVAAIIAAPPIPPASPPSPPPPPLVPPESPPLQPLKSTFALDLLGASAAGAGSSGFGGDLSARLWLFDQRVGARVGAGVRFGELPDAGASVVVTRLAAGVAVRFLPPKLPRASAFDLGARVDAVALWHRLVRNDAEATPRAAASGSFVSPGIAALLEGAWRFTSSFAIVAAAGAEVAFGSIRVVVDNQRVTTIEPLRGVVEVGLRWEP